MKAKSIFEKQTHKIQILRESLLAKHLKDVFDSFYFRKSTTIRINVWMNLSLNQSPSFNEIKNNRA
jgi:hypothetical protein